MTLRLSLAALAACSAVLFSAMPGWAIETVTLPQNSDGTPAFQDPDSHAQSKFSTDQNSKTTTSVGSFHFSVSSDPGFGNDPEHFYRAGGSSAPGYGNPGVPGSEFYSSGGYTIPH